MLISELKPGDVLIADADFDCMESGGSYLVKTDEQADLYVQCRCGRHYLDGQTDDDGKTLIGLSKASAAASAAPQTSGAAPCN